MGEEFEFVRRNDNAKFYDIVTDPDSYYTIPVYVNYKNALRFSNMDPSNYSDPKSGALWQSHLRIEKAWYIYHKLRLYFMRTWWD